MKSHDARSAWRYDSKGSKTLAFVQEEQPAELQHACCVDTARRERGKIGRYASTNKQRSYDNGGADEG